MYFSSFNEMQKAVDIVNTSPHPANKIAATIFGTDESGAPYSISRTNYWPDSIAAKIGMDTRIGSSSGTVHAETACIFAAPYTNGASLCITDPFCPNCAKNMAEAGIRTIYIDHKGFDKDFAARRGDEFSSMSMRICEKAGISVYEIRRKEQKLTPILEIPKSYKPVEDNPIRLEPFAGGAEEGNFLRFLKDKASVFGGKKYAAALAMKSDGSLVSLTALPHAAPGFTASSDAASISTPEGKYSLILEPVNRILTYAPRRGLKLVDGFLFSTQVPTSREQVNIVGAGLSRIYVGNMQDARDMDSFLAAETLMKAGLLDVRSV